MTKKKSAKAKVSVVKEPLAAYGERRIVFFNSFEEENLYVAKETAEIPYDKRLSNIEELRKRVFNKYLLQDDSWAPLEKVFKIMHPYTNDISK